MSDSTTTQSVHAFCKSVLLRGDLQSKLTPGGALDDSDPGPPLEIGLPARDPDLSLVGQSSPLPRPGALGDPSARAECLARFAHHELMAVELFAWALLRWPDVEPALRQDWLALLADEQTHCRLYLQRLEAHGSSLSQHALADYFWKHVPAIVASPAGPRAFLAAMGLTLEQANLDFSLLYRDAFRSAGDEASARVCERVHRDEIRHVHSAAHWIARLADAPGDDLDAYLAAVPFPLSAARAKARRFDVPARQRAGLSARFIAHVRDARSTQETGHPRANDAASPIPGPAESE
jgi:uncharacterized ferritin-like protein (DUF455 family)